MALFLKKHGLPKVFPVSGGMNRWLELGYPTEAVDLEALSAGTA